MILIRLFLYYLSPLIVIGVFYMLMAKHLVQSTRNIPGEMQGQVSRDILGNVPRFNVPFLLQRVRRVFPKMKSSRAGISFRRTRISCNVKLEVFVRKFLSMKLTSAYFLSRVELQDFRILNFSGCNIRNCFPGRFTRVFYRKNYVPKLAITEDSNDETFFSFWIHTITIIVQLLAMFQHCGNCNVV